VTALLAGFMTMNPKTLREVALCCSDWFDFPAWFVHGMVIKNEFVLLSFFS